MTITGRVSPFGYPRINAYSQLPAAFRSVSRPSSPLSAKASTKCPYLSLDSYNINISLSLIFISSQQKIFSLPVILSNRLVYISILSLPRFFLIIRYILSYYSAFSLFTMFYSILFSMILSSFLVEVRRIELLPLCLQSRCSPS